jgi:hypothetical protein
MELTNNRTGLQRIIMIDGHIQGKRTEIKLDQHANLSGTNGAGKTTLLKLIPIFYGLTPSQIVRRTGNRTSFTDYYLPRPTSLLIFEYSNKRGTHCVVMYRHSSGDKSSYRFLAEPFRIDYFSEPRDHKFFFLAGKNLAKHWTLRQLDHSRQIDRVTDYRGVIQGDTNLINRSAESRELRSLVPQYALTNSFGKMRHIDKLTSAILGRSGNMERIKSMLADIMQDDGVTLPTLNPHKSVRNTIIQLNTLRQLDKETAYFRQTIAEGTSYFKGKKRLDSLAAELSVLIDQLHEQLSTSQQQRAEQEESLTVLKKNWESRAIELQSTITAAQSQYERYNRELDTLYRTKEQWEISDIEKKCAAYDKLDQFRETMQQARIQLNALGSKVQHLELELKGYLSDENNRHNQANQQLRDKIEQTKANLHQLEKDFSAKELKLTKQQSSEIDQIKEKFNLDLQTINQAISQANYQAEYAIATTEEQLNLATAEQALAQASSAEQQCRQLLEQQKDKLLAAKQQRNNGLKELKHAQSRLQQAETELQQLTLSCQPKPNSWLAALRQQEPEWFNRIGHVIRQDLLHRTDLAPNFTTEQQSIYGWSIDLKRINKPDWASSLADQQNQLSQQEDIVRLASQAKQSQQAKADKHKLIVDEMETALALAQQKMTISNNRVSTCEQALRRVKAENVDAASQRKAEAKRQAQRLSQQLADASALKDKKIAEYNQLYAERLKELQGLKSVEQGRWQEIIDNCQQGLADELNQHRKNNTTIKRNHQARCSAAGVDEATYMAAQKHWQASQQQYKTVESYQQQVIEYQLWLTTEWSRCQQLTEDLSLAQSQLKQQQQTKEAEQLAFTSQRDKISAIIEGLVNTIRKHQQAFNEAKVLLNQLSKNPQPAAAELSPRNLTLIKTEAEDLLTNQQQLKASIVTAINKVESIISISAVADDQIAQVWNEHKRTIRNDMVNPDDIESLNLALTTALAELLDKQIPQKRQSLMSFVDSIGGQLEDFYIGLNEVSGLIKAESRRISRAINATMEFDALSDIEVSLVSKVDQMEYWPKLKEFHHDWCLWKTDNESALPPKELDNLLINTTEALYRSNSENNLTTTFDLQISLQENRQLVTARRTADLEEVSSTGLTYLVLCSIFAGISRMLCQDPLVNIHWPMDELGTLHAENIPRLFKLLDHYNIIMIGGFPTTDPVLLQHFDKHHEVRPGQGLVELALQPDELTKLMDQRLTATKTNDLNQEATASVH